jgi:hypothetical protein
VRLELSCLFARGCHAYQPAGSQLAANVQNFLAISRETYTPTIKMYISRFAMPYLVCPRWCSLTILPACRSACRQVYRHSLGLQRSEAGASWRAIVLLVRSALYNPSVTLFWKTRATEQVVAMSHWSQHPACGSRLYSKLSGLKVKPLAALDRRMLTVVRAKHADHCPRLQTLLILL